MHLKSSSKYVCWFHQFTQNLPLSQTISFNWWTQDIAFVRFVSFREHSLRNVLCVSKKSCKKKKREGYQVYLYSCVFSQNNLMFQVITWKLSRKKFKQSQYNVKVTHYNVKRIQYLVNLSVYCVEPPVLFSRMAATHLYNGCAFSCPCF